MSKARRRHRLNRYLLGPAHQGLDCRDALRTGGMGEHTNAVGVADAVQMWHDISFRGPSQYSEVLVHGYGTAGVALDPGGGETETLRTGPAAGGDEYGIDLEGRQSDTGNGGSRNGTQLKRRGAEALHAVVDTGDSHAGEGFDTSLLDEQALGQTLDAFVHGRHEGGCGLNDGDLGSQGAVHVGEFQANVPGSNNGQARRDPGKTKRRVAGEDGLAVNHHAGRNHWIRSRRQNDVTCRHDPGALAIHASRRRQGHGLSSRQDPGVSLYDSHALGLQRAPEVFPDGASQILGMRRHLGHLHHHAAITNAALRIH
mmetsp:Transcript_34999/g.62934  ORF Transcript_34999/g.62934 Transcript_34999/m.62934 type:complete len:313 (-) Transcript_34999:641-1579(-)